METFHFRQECPHILLSIADSLQFIHLLCQHRNYWVDFLGNIDRNYQNALFASSRKTIHRKLQIFPLGESFFLLKEPFISFLFDSLKHTRL